MTITDDLFAIAESLDSLRGQFEQPKIKGSLEKLESAVSKIGNAWSGSWLGYHSCVYYEDFKQPPPGAHFSQEWGQWRVAFDGTIGDWTEYAFDDVRQTIYTAAGNPNINALEELSKKAESAFEDRRAEILSLLSTSLEEREDSFL
jgi:hypothetical protein